MKNNLVRKITFSALYLAIAFVLPFLTGQIPEIGSMLSPMHLPVLLCGFTVGWPWGLAVGVIAPILRSAILGMPPMFPTAFAMCFELAAYGAISGIMYKFLPAKKWYIYIALIVAMVAGRVIWGVVMFVLTFLGKSNFTLAIFFAKAIVDAIPGIILQIVLVPLLVMALEKAGLLINRKAK